MAAQLGQPLPNPELGWKRYDDNYPLIFRTGSWVTDTNSNNYGGSRQYSNNGVISFTFKGTKLRLIGDMNYTRSPIVKITIDGVSETFNQYNSTQLWQILVYEKIGLSNTIHNVTIEVTDGKYFSIDAIDIDDTGRLLHPDEVTDIKDLDIGKRIRCNYHAPTSGQVGVFGGLGEETSDFIPPTGSGEPNGDFYFICVDRDYSGRWKLIADRNIQTSISWDTLNSAGIASGSGLPILFGDKIDSLIPISNGYYSSNTPDKAFDEDESTYWESAETRSYIRGVSWIGAEFNEEQKIYGVYLGQNVSLYSVNSVKIQKWNEVNSVWEDVCTANELSTKNFIIFQPTIGKRWRILANSTVNASSGTARWSVREVFFLKVDDRFSGYNLTVRLLTGGINSSDNGNEWDQYIVNSDLNGTITPGDNNVWNWGGVYSWTSTVHTNEPNYRTLRGRNNVNYGTFAQSDYGNGFRPVLLIEILKQHNFSGNIDKNVVHKDPVTLSGTLTALDGYVVSYQVLLNGQVIYEVDDLLPTHDINITIPSDNMVLGSNVIKLVAIDNTGDSYSYWVFNVLKVNTIPFITASMQGLTLNIRIDDPDTDNVKFRIELNGNQVFPPSGYTNFRTPPVLYQHVFKSSDVNIGSSNTLVIYAVDDLGSETTYQLEFIGEYSGLMFADSDGNYYSTDLGEVLKYLDFGGVIAGQTTLSVPIRLINKNGFKVTNIVLSNDNNTQPPGVRLEMSKSDLPFTPETELFYPIVLNYGDEITFYVRLATDAGTPPKSGKVTIFVKGDPIE